MGLKDALERYNRAMPKKGETLLEKPVDAGMKPGDPENPATPEAKSAAELANTREAVEAHAARMFARAVQMDMRPVVTELTSILGITDSGIMREKLIGWLSRAEQLKRNIGADPEVVRILESAIAEVLVKGLRG